MLQKTNKVRKMKEFYSDKELLCKKLLFSPIFKDVSPLTLNNIVSKIEYKINRYKGGEILFFRGDECLELMIVLSGNVVGQMVDFSGKTIEVENISFPRILAPAFIFGNKNNFPVDGVATDDVVVFVVDRNNFLDLISSDKQVLFNYLNIICSRSQFLSEKLNLISFKTIREKFALYCLRLFKQTHNKTFILPMTQTRLSEFFAVSRPALARVIREMVSEKLISCKGREITILDVEGLKQVK